MLRSEMVATHKNAEAERRKSITRILQKLVIANFGSYPDRKRLELAAHTNYTYLMRIYKEETGERLHDFYRRKRNEYAIALIKNTTDSARTISSACGYLNVSQFSRAVKKFTGITFKEIRKSL